MNGPINSVWWDARGSRRRGTTRTFVIDDVAWRVFEYAPAKCPGDVSLMFACESAWRRIRTFPADWADHDDAGLFGLSDIPLM